MPEAALIAVAISDLHLSLTQPVCRADKSWLDVQAHYLKQVREIAKYAPILCAGDIFDRWNPPPELIHFALEHLPDGMISVPGQHDLPNHRIDQMSRSGYGVLVKANKIRDISVSAVKPFMLDGWKILVDGFGWNQEIAPPVIQPQRKWIRVALIHRYCWTVEHSYPGAPEDAHLNAFMKPLKGYDVALFGDNHKGFLKELKTGTKVLNVGGFIRRKSDEMDYQPSIGMIYSDGTVKRRRLDTTLDVFHDKPEEKEEAALDMKAFIDGLESLGEHGLNFREAIENHLRREGIDPAVKRMVIQALEEQK